MNLSTVVVILQLVLSLLSNPASAHNPATQAMATKAINYAMQALRMGVISATNTNTPIQPEKVTYVPQPIQQSQSIGAPDIASIVTQVNIPQPETCSFYVKTGLPNMDARTGEYIWSSTNVPTSTQGQLFFGTEIGIGDNQTQFKWFAIGNPLTQSSGDYVLGYQSIQGPGPYNWATQNQFRMTLGDASCTYTYNP